MVSRRIVTAVLLTAVAGSAGGGDDDRHSAGLEFPVKEESKLR
jgi:hypothetical protein